jgi:hypothetical protein
VKPIGSLTERGPKRIQSLHTRIVVIPVTERAQLPLERRVNPPRVEMQTSFSLTPHKYVNTHRVTEPVCFPTLAHGFDELDDWGMPVAAQASKVDPGVPLCVPKAIGYLTERGVFDIAQLNERRDGQTGKSDDQSSALLSGGKFPVFQTVFPVIRQKVSLFRCKIKFAPTL